VHAQHFDVVDKLRGRVLLNATQGSAAAAAALIQQDDAVVGRIEESSLVGVTAATGAAVQENYSLPGRIAALFVIYMVYFGSLEPSALVGLKFRIQIVNGVGHQALLFFHIDYNGVFKT
jgi:hypothetical protein